MLGYVGRKELATQNSSVRDRWIRDVIEHVTLAPDSITVCCSTTALEQLKIHDFEASAEPVPFPACVHTPHIEAGEDIVTLSLRIQIKKIDGRRILLSPDGHDLVIPSVPRPSRHIVDAIGLAYRWHDELMTTGLEIAAFARKHGIARTRILKLLPLT